MHTCLRTRAYIRSPSGQQICLLDPVTGFDSLIRIIEDVLLAHVLRGED